MLFKSQVYAQASGSIGGITYSHNKGGMYARARAVPTNPNTSYQQVVRSLMSLLSTRWLNTLTAAQRAAWTLYGDSVPVVNRLGEQIYLSGLNHFVRSNIPRAQAGLSYVDDGPTVFAMASFTAPSLVVNGTTDAMAVTFDNTDAWANEVGGAMFVYIGPPKSPTINYYKGPYRFADLIAGAGTPPTSPASIDLPFPATSGDKVFSRITVCRADGRLSPDFRTGSVAT